MSTSQQPYDLNADIGSRALIAGILSIALSAVFIAGRLAARSIKKNALDASDYVLLVGMVSAWGIDALTIYAKTQGMGRHFAAVAMADPTLSGPKRIMKILIAIECLYAISLGCIKISFLLLFRRLFPGKQFLRIIYMVAAVIVLWAVAIFWMAIFACNPVHAFWDFPLPSSAKCINNVHFYIGSWVPNFLTDIAILSLPQTRVWKLQIDLKTKIALACTFLLGGFVTIASVIRFTTIFQVDPKDYNYSLNTLAVWTAIELAAALASASMPVMRPLMHKIFREPLSKSNGRGTSGNRQIVGRNDTKELSNLDHNLLRGHNSKFQRLDDALQMSAGFEELSRNERG